MLFLTYNSTTQYKLIVCVLVQGTTGKAEERDDAWRTAGEGAGGVQHGSIVSPDPVSEEQYPGAY